MTRQQSKLEHLPAKRFQFWTIQASKPSGLYNKHVTIVNDDFSIINMWHLSLTDDAGVIIYDRNVFIEQATGV